MLRYLFVFILAFSSVSAKEITKILPGPSGEYCVGYTQHEYQMPNGRRLKTTISYPTRQSGLEPLDYAEILAWEKTYNNQNLNFFDKALNSILPSFLAIESDGVKDFSAAVSEIHVSRKKAASKAEGQFPVVYFMPAYDMNPGHYLTLIGEVVSHGYVVIASHHPEISACVTFADGSVAYENKPDRPAELMKDDLEYLLLTLEEDDDLTTFCDFSKTALMGHQLGGHVLQLSQCDEVRKISAKIMLEDKARNYVIDEKPTFYAFASTVDDLHVAGLRNHGGEHLDVKLYDDFTYGNFSDDALIIGMLNGEDQNDLSRKHITFTTDLRAFLAEFMT